MYSSLLPSQTGEGQRLLNLEWQNSAEKWFSQKCLSESWAQNSGGVVGTSPAMHWEALSTDEKVQQELTEAAFRSIRESPRVLGMWARILPLVTAWLIEFCLFTRIYKNTWFHCFWVCFFFLLAGLVEVHSLYNVARLISCRWCLPTWHMFQHIAGIYWHLCKERPDALRKWSSWPLCSAVEWSG